MPMDKKAKTKVKISISELDTTLINLQELFRNEDIIVTLRFGLHQDKKEIKRVFELLECYSCASNSPLRKPPTYIS